MQGNNFLNQFITMRKQISAPPTVVKPTKASKQVQQPVEHGGITYKYIIEEKPGKTEVLQYFRDRIEEICAEEEANDE